MTHEILPGSLIYDSMALRLILAIDDSRMTVLYVNKTSLPRMHEFDAQTIIPVWMLHIKHGLFKHLRVNQR